MPEKTYWPEYDAIAAFYGDRTARRSGVRLMNHIDEGLKILEAIGAGYDAKSAFCLHPLFQADAELMTVGLQYMGSRTDVDAKLVMLTMEYRARANAVLSGQVLGSANGLSLHMRVQADPGPLQDVRLMLIADKVQNRKDFEQFHKGKHARSDELDFYFKHWLMKLGIVERHYQELLEVMR